MGTDKAFLRFGGRYLLELLVEHFWAAGQPVCLSSARGDTGRRLCHLKNLPEEIRDIVPDAGPAGGIYSLLSHLHCGIFVTATDMPFADWRLCQCLMTLGGVETGYDGRQGAGADYGGRQSAGSGYGGRQSTGAGYGGRQSTGADYGGRQSTRADYDRHQSIGADQDARQDDALERDHGLKAGPDAADMVVLERKDGRREMLFAYYGPGCLKPLEALIKAGDYRLQSLIPKVNCKLIGEAQLEQCYGGGCGRALFNMNTPGDYQRALQLFRAGADDIKSTGGPVSGNHEEGLHLRAIAQRHELF